MTLIWFVVWLVFNRRRRQRAPHVRSRELVDGIAAPGHRPRPEPTARPPARQDVGRRLTEPSPIHRMTRAPHALAAEDVARALDARSRARPERRRGRRAPRSVRPESASASPPPRIPAIALRQFADPLVGLLIGAAHRLAPDRRADRGGGDRRHRPLERASRLRPGGPRRERGARAPRRSRGARERGSGRPGARGRRRAARSRRSRRPPRGRAGAGGRAAGRRGGARGRRVDPDRRVRAGRQGGRRGAARDAAGGAHLDRLRGLVGDARARSWDRHGNGLGDGAGCDRGTDGAGEATAHAVAAPHRCAHPR